MEEKVYAVYYNAFRTEYGRHLLAIGWCNEAGWTPVIKEEESMYKFTIEKTGEISAQVVTPFCISAEIFNDPRSISVKDDYGTYQVQVYGIVGESSGKNEPGKWINSGKL